MYENHDLIPTRQSLLSRLRDWDDNGSWQVFFDTYWKLIFKTACNAGLSRGEAEEVVQETLISICKAIREFQYDPKQGSFKGWLRTTIVWRIQDQMRRQERLRPGTAELAQGWHNLVNTADPASDLIAKNWDADYEKNLTDAALERLKKRTGPKQFQIFDLAVIKQWQTRKVAKALKVSPAYIYLVKHRLTSRFKAELRKLRKDPCENPEFLQTLEYDQPRKA